MLLKAAAANLRVNSAPTILSSSPTTLMRAAQLVSTGASHPNAASATWKKNAALAVPLSIVKLKELVLLPLRSARLNAKCVAIPTNVLPIFLPIAASLDKFGAKVLNHVSIAPSNAFANSPLWVALCTMALLNAWLHREANAKLQLRNALQELMILYSSFTPTNGLMPAALL